MMCATDLAARLGLKRYPRSWRGRCPSCDYLGTFSVRAGRDGRALLFCASCQDRDALADAVARATGQERQPELRDDPDAQAVRGTETACGAAPLARIGHPPPTRRQMPISHTAVYLALPHRPLCGSGETPGTRKADGIRR